ncbi:MAG: CRISPR system precrRNA processing endoribonuclease RAMP protein Cas6 [Chloroflexales bacterium]|nr:CRISPR system precrRNA processing endoribonuclease RAMP protein Cas6 [Chloroflexales bacterium]
MLTTHHLTFTATALTAVALGEQSGSALRGAVAGALWGRFCANRAAPACDQCPLMGVCPVAALLAPMRDEGQKGGEQRPRPYVVRPPRDGARTYAPGEPLRFGLALFGSAAALFPYVVMAAGELEREGLGLRLPQLGGRRGTLRLGEIAAVNPLTGEHQPLYTAGTGQVRQPGLPIDAGAVRAYAATLPADAITLHFHTPLRLIEQDRLLKRIALRPLVQRLMRRLDDLSIAYGEGPLGIDFRALLELAEGVRVAEDRTGWVDVVSSSSRQQRRTPIGGLVGSATFAGELGPLRELLAWGSLVHVGKNAVKGDGWYSVVDPCAAPTNAEADLAYAL